RRWRRRSRRRRRRRSARGMSYPEATAVRDGRKADLQVVRERRVGRVGEVEAALERREDGAAGAEEEEVDDGVDHGYSRGRWDRWCASECSGVFRLRTCPTQDPGARAPDAGDPGPFPCVTVW